MNKTRVIVWHPHDELPVYEPNGDNRLIVCLNMGHLRVGNLEGLCVSYMDLNPDGSINYCSDGWHSKKWLKKHAMRWEHQYKEIWWTYVRDLTPVGI